MVAFLRLPGEAAGQAVARQGVGGDDRAVPAGPAQGPQQRHRVVLQRRDDHGAASRCGGDAGGQGGGLGSVVEVVIVGGDGAPVGAVPEAVADQVAVIVVLHQHYRFVDAERVVEIVGEGLSHRIGAVNPAEGGGAVGDVVD